MAQRSFFMNIAIGMALSLGSVAMLLTLQGADAPQQDSPTEEDPVSLRELAREAPPAEVEANVVTTAEGRSELILYSRASVEAPDEGAEEVSIEVADGETITVARRDLELGTRIPWNVAAPGGVVTGRGASPDTGGSPSARPSPGTGGETPPPPAPPREAGPKIFTADRSLEVRLQPVERLTLPAATPRPPVFVLETGNYRLSQDGNGLEMPIYILVRERQDDGSLRAATADSDIDFVMEAPRIPGQRVKIEKDRTRSTAPVYFPLRRAQSLEITASRLRGPGEPATLDLRWEAHVPSMELRVSPDPAEGYTTRLSPLSLSVRLESGGRRLRPDFELPIDVEGLSGLSLTPAAPVLGTDGRAARVEVHSSQVLQRTAIFSVPGFDLEASVPVSFVIPWKLLAIAGLLGLVGVVVARRGQLLAQKRIAIAFELLTAAAGGLLLYTAFLLQWLPSPGEVIGELPAAAIGILGGYLGEGVFQLVAKRLNLIQPEEEASQDPEAEPPDPTPDGTPPAPAPQ